MNGQRNYEFFKKRYLIWHLSCIARYQPVATDLRYIKSCLEISYVLSRFGGYGYEIVEVLDMMGSISECDKTVVKEAAEGNFRDDLP